MELSANLEDYLKIIFFLEQENKAARVKDIAEKMGVQKASVTGALQSLAQKRLIYYTPYSSVTLTPDGFKRASEVVYKNRVLYEFFHFILGLKEDVADKNACRLEHHLDDEALKALSEFIQFVYQCPRAGKEWLEKFKSFFDDQKKPCKKCVEEIFTKLKTH